MANSIDPKTLDKKIAEGKAPVLIDVRRKADYEAAPDMIPGAEWHDPEKIDEWIKDIPEERPVVAYCVKGGAVSQSVAERMGKAGFDASFLEGGIKAWSESGEGPEDSGDKKS